MLEVSFCLFRLEKWISVHESDHLEVTLELNLVHLWIEKQPKKSPFLNNGNFGSRRKFKQSKTNIFRFQRSQTACIRETKVNDLSCNCCKSARKGVNY